MEARRCGTLARASGSFQPARRIGATYLNSVYSPPGSGWRSCAIQSEGGNVERGRTCAGWLLAQESAEEVDGVLAALPAGAPQRHQDCLSMGANPGAVAAPEFAQDHTEADGLFGAPVGGVQAGVFEEGQQVVAVLPQVLGEAVV